MLVVEPEEQKENAMIEWIKKQWEEHAEWRWALAALALWLVVGVALEPVTATVSLDFVHKITAGIFRAAVAVWLTFLEVRLVFPTLHAWRNAGKFAQAWNEPSDELNEDIRLVCAVAVHAALFIGNVIALSL